MKVFVTGGAGYIGSHACKRLAQAGHEPVVYDNLVYGHRDAVRWGPLIEGDLTNAARLEAAFKQVKPEAAMHFAAYAYVGESVVDPIKYYLNNVAGTVVLLKACIAQGVKKFVFSSSCAVYGTPSRLPMDESLPPAPINPYGHTKLNCEQLLQAIQNAHGLRWVALRYFNAAGADREGELGEHHDPETHLIPLAIKAAMGGTPLNVYGGDYATPDGTAIRDYIHVSDLATAHACALDYLDAGNETTHPSRAMNLAMGQGYSVLQVIQAVEAVSGRKVPYKTTVRRAGDPPALYADAALAKKALEWSPQYRSINEIVKTAWNWHLKQQI